MLELLLPDERPDDTEDFDDERVDFTDDPLRLEEEVAEDRDDDLLDLTEERLLELELRGAP